LKRLAFILICLFLASICVSGCKSPDQHSRKADERAYEIIRQKQIEAMGKVEAFTIERPSDLLRRRLLVDQRLIYKDQSSLGSDKLKPIDHWPVGNYLEKSPDGKSPKAVSGKEPVTLSLVESLQVGARNSSVYQDQKENVFRAALNLDLEENNFRSIFGQRIKSLVQSDTTGEKASSGTVSSSESSFSKNFKNGAALTAGLAVDLANLLTSTRPSSLGLQLDTSISIPLLRGSGRHIVTEPLTQAQRDVVYQIYTFEKFKRSFAVDIASDYLSALRKLDQINNAEDNYRRLTYSVRRARRMADAGQLPEIQVDQAVQNQLRARDRWVAAIQSYESAVDSFKILIGLPTDSLIELDRAELNILAADAEELYSKDDNPVQQDEQSSAEADIVLAPAGGVNPGPYEIDQKIAISLALKNRLDLRIAEGRIYDAQRDVVITADDLRGELTLMGTAKSGNRRSVSSAGDDNARLRAAKTELFALMTLDLPIERTEERNEYRNSLMGLEKKLRDKNLLEDEIKLQVRNDLRNLLKTRESIQIQAKSVDVAQKRVDSTNLFLKAGRAQIRDVLEAQDSLLSAQNSLTSAVVSYRITELQLQRDMGVLNVGANGLWQEFGP